MKGDRFSVVSGPIEYAGVTYRSGEEIPAMRETDARILELLGKVRIIRGRRSRKVTTDATADGGDSAAPYNTREKTCESG